MQDNFIALKKTARQTGVLYLLLVITGIYGLMFVSSQTIVPGDAGATAKKILANESLFRTGIINNIISNTVWIFLALNLYRLFKHVYESQARLLVSLVLVQIPILFFMEALNITALMAFKGEILKTMEMNQRQEFAMLLLKINGFATIVAETFWGLWLFPLALLIYKSGFIPKVFSVLLYLNGIAYVIHSFTFILFPGQEAIVKNICFPFWIAGEISITFWLIIKGVKKNE
jgi:hypothetical protein